MKIFVITPSKVSKTEKKFIDDYILNLESKGNTVTKTVYSAKEFPACHKTHLLNQKNMYLSHIVYLFYKKDPMVQYYLGMADAYSLPLIIMNPEQVDANEGLTIENLIFYTDSKSQDTPELYEKMETINGKFREN